MKMILNLFLSSFTNCRTLQETVTCNISSYLNFIVNLHTLTFVAEWNGWTKNRKTNQEIKGDKRKDKGSKGETKRKVSNYTKISVELSILLFASSNIGKGFVHVKNPISRRKCSASYQKTNLKKCSYQSRYFCTFRKLQVLHEINLIISLKLIITYNLSHIYIATCHGFSLLHYYVNIFTVKKTLPGTRRVFWTYLLIKICLSTSPK